ncbi:GTP-binding protein [bacterium]|jgi:bifunctional enzyme CysN/CysC|nr:GTP-binding protein [bacterium]
MTNTNQEQLEIGMNIVIVGHVDHGKSTVIGRLLADTDSLPEGKLEQVKQVCEINSKPFEYAFLLDALKDEQAQGITIDTARVFFKSKKRRYIILDAPGHIEFLKNMITGAARAEAALLVIDANEGVQENSRRHGYMLSMLGIKQVVVLINKMDLVDYKQDRFEAVRDEYSDFLKEIGVEPLAYVPIAAREGDVMVGPSDNMPWYSGNSVLESVDAFEKESKKEDKTLRMPVQDIYKFTSKDDDRRIVSGMIETGSVSVGDDVIFYPSMKQSTVASIEGFNVEKQTVASAGMATGVTLSTQIYLRPGELMCKVGEAPANVGDSIRVRLFWMGRSPMVKGKAYKLKLGATRATVYLTDIVSVMDASNLTTEVKEEVGRHDVAEVILQSQKPIAFDLSHEIESTGRFVIVDDYEIAGGGIVSEAVDQGRLDLSDSERVFTIINDAMNNQTIEVKKILPDVIEKLGQCSIEQLREIESNIS